MVIDFHTHVFPDKIAQKTIDYLSQKGGIPAFSDGSVNGLLSQMEQAGVDLAITLPVVTKPSQFDSINRFAKEINETFAHGDRRLISFAGIHPACDDLEGKVAWIAENGFLGIKLHPDYQETFIDDQRYIRILKAAKRHGLIVVTHAGVDGGYRDQPIRCTPQRVKRVIDEVGHSKFVLAHLGANEQFEEVYDLLCGCDVYFDTAYILRFVGKDTFQKILHKHGADKILFASDSPWSSMQNDVEILKSISPDPTTANKLLSENAMKLLGM